MHRKYEAWVVGTGRASWRPTSQMLGVLSDVGCIRSCNCKHGGESCNTHHKLEARVVGTGCASWRPTFQTLVVLSDVGCIRSCSCKHGREESRNMHRKHEARVVGTGCASWWPTFQMLIVLSDVGCICSCNCKHGAGEELESHYSCSVGGQQSWFSSRFRPIWFPCLLPLPLEDALAMGLRSLPLSWITSSLQV